MSVNYGPSSDVVPLFADLPPARLRRPGAFATLASGQGYTVQFVAGVLTWVPNTAGGGGGSPLKYVIAQIGTPMANAGTYPDVEAAYAAALADFGGVPPIKASFVCQPGTYPGFRLRPGMHIGLFTDGGIAAIRIPPVPNLDTPPLVFTGTIEVRAADGWNVGLGDPQPNASISNAKIATAGAASCLQIGAGVTTGQVSLSRCVLTPETGIAIEEIAGGLSIDALTISCENVQIEAFGTIPAPIGVAFNGTNVRLQFFDSCRVQGSLSTQQAEGIVFSDSALVRAPVTASTVVVPPFTGSVNVRFIRSTMVSVGDGSPLLVLNDGCSAAFEGCTAQPNGAPQTIDGTGGIVFLYSGSLPGFQSAPPQISILAGTSGQSLSLPTQIPPPATIDANGYVVFAGPGPFNFAIPDGLGLEFIPFDCSGADPGSTANITLPNARLAMAWSPLKLKRIDQNGGIVFNLQTAAPNEFDKTVPPTTFVTIGPGASLDLIASREPAGVGRWLVTT